MASMIPHKYRLSDHDYGVLSALSEEDSDPEVVPAVLLELDVDYESKAKLELREFVVWTRPTPHESQQETHIAIPMADGLARSGLRPKAKLR